jgi:hypothetical protein
LYSVGTTGLERLFGTIDEKHPHKVSFGSGEDGAPSPPECPPSAPVAESRRPTEGPTRQAYAGRLQQLRALQKPRRRLDGSGVDQVPRFSEKDLDAIALTWGAEDEDEAGKEKVKAAGGGNGSPGKKNKGDRRSAPQRRPATLARDPDRPAAGGCFPPLAPMPRQRRGSAAPVTEAALEGDFKDAPRPAHCTPFGF